MKKILMLAYHFHPDPSVGALRSVKFAKYLPSFGWEPHVVSVDSRFYGTKDKVPLDFDCTIQRTGKWPTPSDLYLNLKSVFGRISKHRNVIGQKDAIGEDEVADLKHQRVKWRQFLNSLWSTPDLHVGWLCPAVRRSVDLIRREGIDVIYSSGPPHTAHIVGWITKLITGKKLVTDFRDPWSFALVHKTGTPSYAIAIEQYLERKVISASDLVLTTVPELRDKFIESYGPLLNGKCYSILNGFDEEDFAGLQRHPKSPNKPITLLHAGTLYYGRDPSKFCEVVACLLREGTIDRRELVIKFVGSVDLSLAGIRKVVAENDLSENVVFSQRVDRATYLSMIMNADILLLVQSSLASLAIPAKTFDYLATGNEIIALVGSGSTSNYLAGIERAHVTDLDDTTSIRSAIMKAVQRARDRRACVTETMTVDEGPSKRQLTGILAGLLESL